MRATDESVRLSRHINMFLNADAVLAKTRSACTLKSHHDAMSLYLEFLEAVKRIRPEKFNSGCFSVENIEQWLTWLSDTRFCCPETCNNRLASIRSFLKYLAKKDVAFFNLSQAASQIDRRKTSTKKISGMSKNAVQALLSAPDTRTATGRRDMALMIVMYSTAARIDEILSMKIENLHLEARKPCITILGKGAKVRTLYLTPKAVSHLRAYLSEVHGDVPNSSSYVFFSRSAGSHAKMSQAAVNKRLRKYALEAHKVCTEVPVDLHAHQFRHAKASHWLEDGMNIVQISFLLGHAQLQTTMVYLDISTEQEIKALSTLESEVEKSITKKWSTDKGSLSALCGARKIT